LKGSGFSQLHKSKSNGNWAKLRHRTLTQTRLDGRKLIPDGNKICWFKNSKWNVLKEEE